MFNKRACIVNILPTTLTQLNNYFSKKLMSIAYPVIIQALLDVFFLAMPSNMNKKDGPMTPNSILIESIIGRSQFNLHSVHNVLASKE